MPRGNQSGLTPWVKGDGRAAAAGRKSAEVRALKRDAERADIAGMVRHLRTLADHADGVDVSRTCIGVAVYVLGLVTAGTVPIRHGGDAAELVRVLVDVARLAGGQPTSTAVVAHLTSADARARLAELAALAGGVLGEGDGAEVDGGTAGVSPAAVAAEDVPPATTSAGGGGELGGGRASSPAGGAG